MYLHFSFAFILFQTCLLLFMNHMLLTNKLLPNFFRYGSVSTEQGNNQLGGLGRGRWEAGLVGGGFEEGERARCGRTWEKEERGGRKEERGERINEEGVLRVSTPSGEKDQRSGRETSKGFCGENNQELGNGEGKEGEGSEYIQEAVEEEEFTSKRKDKGKGQASTQ